MTIREWINKNNSSQRELAKIVGCSVNTIYHITNGRSVTKEDIANKLTELGIEFKRYNPKKRGQKLPDFLYQENLHINECPIDEIYCYSLERVNEVTKFLNEKKICYYVRAEEWYWTIKYDVTLKDEELVS